MKNLLIRINLYLLLFSASTAVGLTAGDIKITYISSEAVYIDGGTANGLHLGDSLNIYRNDVLQATLVVTNISSGSSACTIINQTGNLSPGDIVAFDGQSQADSEPISDMTDKIRRPENRESYRPGRLSGYLSIQNYWQQDMTGSSLSYTQPSLVSRIMVDNIAGSNINLLIRHRSRITFRTQKLGSSINADQWYHRVYQIALSNNPQGSWYWRLGRQSVTELSGIGLIDGLTISRRFSDFMRAGFAVGFEPDWETTDISFENRKAGFFADWRNKNEIHNIGFRLGLTGSYYKMEINREFLSLQTSYRFKNRFSFSEIMEIDINRSWRKNPDNSVFDISNLFLNVRYQATSFLALYTSYDRRSNYRVFETRNTPDTLFDDNLHQGFKAGYSLQINGNMRLNGYGGIRFREGLYDNNIVVSSSLSLRRFPLQNQSVISSFTYIKSEFTSGYRSSIRYSFPAGRKTRVSLTDTIYKYSGLLLSKTYYYLDLSINYSLSRTYYISGSYRQNFDRENLSGQMFFQLGIDI